MVGFGDCGVGNVNLNKGFLCFNIYLRRIKWDLKSHVLRIDHVLASTNLPY